MAGLINSKMAPSGPAPAEAMPPEQAAPDGGEDFTPEQSAALDKFSLACQEALYGGKGTAEQMAESITSAPDVANGLADLAYNTMAMLDEASGGMLEDELMPAAAADVLGQIVEVAQAAGAKVGSREVAKATQIMLSRYLSESGASDEEVQQFMGASNPDEVGDAIDQRDAGAPPAGGMA